MIKILAKSLYSARVTVGCFCQIKTLNDIWNQNYKQKYVPFIMQTNNPKQLMLESLKFLMQNKFMDHELSKQLKDKIDQKIEDKEYLLLLVKLLVPLHHRFKQFNKLYLKIAFNYLEMIEKPDFESMQYIIINLRRICIHKEKEEYLDDKWLIRQYFEEQKLMKKFIPVFIKHLDLFNYYFKLQVVNLSSFLNIYDAQLSQMVIDTLRQEKCRYKLKNFLQLYYYLSKAKYFPYELFYKKAYQWIRALENQNKYSKKKTSCLIKYLQVLSSSKPHKFEIIESKLIKLIKQSIPSLDSAQISQIWYLYVKSSFSMEQQLTLSLWHKVTELVDKMQIMQLCLIVRSFSKIKSPYVMKLLIENGIHSLLRAILSKIQNQKQYESQICKVMLKNLQQQKSVPSTA